MGDNLGPNGSSRRCRVFLLQVDIAKIVIEETDEPNTLVDFLDADFLAGEHGGDVDPLAMHPDTAAGGDEDFAIVERVGDLGQAVGLRLSGRWRALHGEGLVWSFGVELATK